MRSPNALATSVGGFGITAPSIPEDYPIDFGTILSTSWDEGTQHIEEDVKQLLTPVELWRLSRNDATVRDRSVLDAATKKDVKEH